MNDDRDDLVRAARARLDMLSVKERNALLFDLLEELQVESLVMPGENGTIEGFVADRVVALKYFKNRVWSPAIVGAARAVLEGAGGGSYIDLGANIGMTTIPIARLPGVRCVAVEPHPDNYRLLNLNLTRNGVARAVTTHFAAIYTEESTVPLELAPENLGDHRLQSADAGEDRYGESKRRRIEVPAATLDALIEPVDLRHPVVTKIDIQGAEPYAFTHGARVLSATQLLLMEYWPYGIERLGTPIARFLDLVGAEFTYGALLEEETRPADIKPETFDTLRPKLEAFASRGTIEATDVALARSAEALRFG